MNRIIKKLCRIDSSAKKQKLNFTILALAFLFISVVSCKKDNVEAGISVNIKNISNYDFTNINLDGKNYGDLKKGTESLYMTFDTVHYDLVYVKLYINGNEFISLPIDDDAPELTKGSCTYLINVLNFEDRRLDIKTEPKK